MFFFFGSLWVKFLSHAAKVAKQPSELVIDFKGARTGFEVMKFDAPSDWPAFARLDEYDTPSEPDETALAAMLTREYPKDFSPAR